MFHSSVTRSCTGCIGDSAGDGRSVSESPDPAESPPERCMGATTTAPIRDVRCEKGENMTDDNTQTSLNDKGRYWAGLIYPTAVPMTGKQPCKCRVCRYWFRQSMTRTSRILKTGKLKKPHRHVVAMWTNTTTRRNATRFFEQFNGPKTILRVESPRGMARYWSISITLKKFSICRKM